MLTMDQTYLFLRGYSIGGGGETQPSTVHWSRWPLSARIAPAVIAAEIR